MRVTLLLVAIAFGLAGSAFAEQDPSPRPQAPSPVFRAGVELVSVDVTALDGNGRQVTDLKPEEFQVEVDGEKRQVSTVEYVRAADPLRAINGAPKTIVRDETYATSNAKGAPSGRLIVLLIDQGNIRTGAARSVMNSARKFIDTLTPEDRVAVIAIPSPGELVDFTTDHDKAREALLRIVGAADVIKTRFNLSITEAMALYLHSNQLLASQVIERECAGLSAVDVERCARDLENESAEIVTEIRRRTDNSVSGMRAVIKGLGAFEGPKSMIIMSEGLIFEGLGSETEELGLLAADSRVTIDVLLMDVPQFDVEVSRRPNTPREDRNLQTAGLEQIAGASRGQLYRINTTADFAFDRISHSLDGYYLLGVESRGNDKNGKRHRIGVRTTRRGVNIQARRGFLTTLSGKAGNATEAVARALRSLLPINDLPLKISTWTYKQPGSNKVRVLVAAEAERLADQALDYTVGVAIVNKDGRGVSTPVELKTFAEKRGDPGTAVYSSMLAVDPGEYRLIVSISDSEGRVGSVSRAVTAYQLDGAGLSVGDLLVGPYDDGPKAMIEPAIEPAVSGPMAALMEAYSPSLGSSAGTNGPIGMEATLEILTDEAGAPLAMVPMRVSAGSSPEIANISAQFNTSTLPPGRYLARGVIKQDGKPQGHIVRPFRILPPDAANAAAPGILPNEVTMVLLGGITNFDRKEILAPAVLAAAFTSAEARPTGSKSAIKEARGGDFGGAAMTALGDGDQALATFLKGLELYQGAQLDKAAIQFQSSMQMAPAFAPARLFLGAALAEGNRHKDAAGLLQSASETSAAVARIAGEEWIKAGQPVLAIKPLELAVQQPGADAKSRKLLAFAYVLGGRPADAPTVLAPYLDANPTDMPALLAGIYGLYNRHLGAPHAATLAADRASMARWSKAYVAGKGPMQALVAAWVKHVEELK